VLFFSVLPSYGQLQFVENKGQWDSRVNFRADIQTGAFFIERKGFTVLQHNSHDLEELAAMSHAHAPLRRQMCHCRKRLLLQKGLYTTVTRL
jgi:hypothetical protein